MKSSKVTAESGLRAHLAVFDGGLQLMGLVVESPKGVDVLLIMMGDVHGLGGFLHSACSAVLEACPPAVLECCSTHRQAK